MNCLSHLNPFTFFTMPPALNSSSSVDLLILGAGWTSTFLLPHLTTRHPSISFAATTRDGRDGTIKWAWDLQGGAEQYELLPRAKTEIGRAHV